MDMMEEPSQNITFSIPRTLTKMALYQTLNLPVWSFQTHAKLGFPDRFDLLH